MKKLRYSIYFFESLFSTSREVKALSRYKDHLAGLQDSLGALNDIAVHQKMVTKLGTDDLDAKSHLIAFAAGAVVGSEHGEIEPFLGAAEAAARKLRRAQKFRV